MGLPIKILRLNLPQNFISAHLLKGLFSIMVSWFFFAQYLMVEGLIYENNCKYMLNLIIVFLEKIKRQ